MSASANVRARALALARSLLDVAPAERAERLRQACAGDTELLHATESLLAADAADHTLLDGPLDVDAYLATDAMRGARIGPYRVIEALGRGGMGAVYRAERVDGVAGHQVALKTIKRGMDSDEIVRRFRQEREILARLAHPNIARLLDGGVAENGQLWFAMELVEGRPITEACDARRLDVRERAKLFLAVCDAVQFAHANLVVHRDLKPNNVLLGASGEVKLLDFGIGKLLDLPNAEQTQSQLRMLTPEFAAPEQLRGEPITTATDVYQLGLLLFELLGGRRAPSPRAGRAMPRLSVAFAEWRSADPAGAEAAAAQRGTDARGLQRMLAGDLDRIVERALDEEPARRYESATALGADLARHIEGRAVLAAGNAWTYRTKKFVRRNRIAVGAAALVLAAIVAGVAGVVWQARKAREAATIARAEAATSRNVKDFLIDVFRSASPEQALGRPLSAREMIDIGARRVGFELSDEPAVQIAMYSALGEIYTGLGDKTAAAESFRAGLERAERQLGADAPTTDGLRVDLAGALTLDEAKPGPASEEATRLLDAVLARPAGDVERAKIGLRAEIARGRQQAALGKRTAAEATLRSAVAGARALGADGEELLATSLIALGSNFEALERCIDAVPLFRESLAIRERRFDRRSPDVTEAQQQVALCLDDEGSAAEAEAIERSVVATDREVLGDTHPDTAEALHMLGTILLDERRNAEAEPLLKQALSIFEERLGANSDRVAELSNSLCVLKLNMHEYDASIAYGRRAAEIFALNHGPLYEYALLARYDAALAQFNSGEYATAEAEFVEVRDLRQQAGLAPATWLLNQLGRARRVAGRPDEAKSLAEQAIQVAEAGNGGASFDALMAHAELALDERDLGDLDASRRDQQFTLDKLTATFPNAKSSISDARLVLAEIDYMQGHCTTALPVFEAVLDERSHRTPRDDVRVDEARFLVASCAATGAAASERSERLASARRIANASTADPFLRQQAKLTLASAH